MEEIYILSKSNLKRMDNTVVIQSGRSKKFIPVQDLKDIYVMSDLDLNSRFIQFISGYDICLHYFSYYGNYLGCYKAVNSKRSGNVLRSQVKCFENKRKRLDLAKHLIRATIMNILRNLRYYHNRGRGNFVIYERFLLNCSNKIDDCNDIPKLMGLEGIVRREYYKLFPHILKKSYNFSRRNKRPPKDPINALISFGNSLLYSVVQSELYNVKLDPSIAVIHATNERSNSLSLDIADMFKPIITDRILFYLINMRILTEKDFSYKDDCCLLNDNGRRKYITKYNKKLSTTFYHRKLGRRLSYRSLIKQECREIRDFVIGKCDLSGFNFWW